MELIDIFGFGIPATFSSFLSSVVWVRKTKFENMIRQLVESSKEGYPEYTVKCLKYLSILISSIMLKIAMFLVIRDGIWKGDFSPTFIVIGLLMLAATVSPVVYYYYKYKSEPENEDPYVIDLKESPLSTPLVAEDKHYDTVLKELEDYSRDQEKQNKPGN